MDPALRNYFTNKEIATEYDATFAENNLFQFDTQILDRVFAEPCTLLDLGCGTGRHLIHFARRKFSVTGVDLSSHMLAVTAEKIRNEGLMARLVQTDLQNLDGVQDEFYHGAICMFSTLGMIQPRAARQHALRLIRRKLKPGASLVLHAHNKFFHMRSAGGMLWLAFSFLESLAHRGDFGDKRFLNYRGIPNMPLHLFSCSELARDLREAGFNVTEIFPLTARRDAILDGRLKYLRCNGFICIAVKGSDDTAA